MPLRARLRTVWLALAAIVTFGFIWSLLPAQPTALPEAKEARLPFPCVSYAPFRRAGHTPFDPDLRVTAAEIESDLRLLATVTSCIRTYGIDHGLDAVPEIARRLGLRVILGAWVGRDPLANARQLDRAIALTHSHRDVIDLLIVGNEVLLRRELEPAALANLLAQARRAAAVPVSYADVWAFWERHADALVPHVDVVSAHILPYWEDEPVDRADAVDYIYRKAAELRQTFAGKPVFIAETGWPAAGRQRGPAVPGHVEQARFVRDLLAREAKEPLHFNFIEGFDQPWKRRLEGTMGGAWGLFDARGELRVPLAGPLAPAPRFAIPYWLALPEPPFRANAWREWGVGLGMVFIALACVTAGLRRLIVLGRGDTSPSDRFLNAALVVLLGLLAVDALWLIFDGRYRPIRWEPAFVPALLLLALAWLRDRLPARRWAQRPLAAGAAFAGVVVVGREGLENTQALLYGAGLCALATAALFLYRSHRAVAPSNRDGRSCRPPSA